MNKEELTYDDRNKLEQVERVERQMSGDNFSEVQFDIYNKFMHFILFVQCYYNSAFITHMLKQVGVR